MSNVKQITKNAGEILQFGSTTIRIVENGSGTDNRLSAIASTMGPHTEGPPPHIHLMHDEAFLITSGVLCFKIGDIRLDARAREYVVAPAGGPHTFVNTSDEQVSFFTTFTPASYISALRELA